MKTYSLTAKWKFFYGVYALLGIVGMYNFLRRLFVTGDQNSIGSIIILVIEILVFAYVTVSGGYSLLKTHIQFSNGKFEYRTFLISYSAKWNEISKIETKKNRFKQEGIYIKSQTAKGSPVIGKHPDGLDVFIPIFMFLESWRESELGQQIKQYAPHLFEQEKSVKSVAKTI
jgi:hypothetical protein